MAGIDLSKYNQTSTHDSAEPKKPGSGPLDWMNRDIQLFGTSLSDKKKEAFYMELGILLTAGVDIKTCLELIADEQEKEKDRLLFTSIKERVIQGSTLSDAIRESAKFGMYEFYSLQIGEESGKLAIILRELAEFYQKKTKQRRQVVSVLTYPVIVLCTSMGAVFFMMNFIVPMFADVFKRFGGELPFITKLILRIADGFQQYFFVGLVAIVLGIALVITQRRKAWFRSASANLMLRIPLLGEIIRKIYLARFCHSMTLLIGSHIPLLRAIGLIKQMIGFYPIEVSLTKVEADIMQGKSLHESLAAFAIYPKRMTSLIKVGEEVNQLDGFFNKIAKQYTEEIEHQTTLIGSMIEPFMIIFLGIVVGVILIAMYLPLFQLSTTF